MGSSQVGAVEAATVLSRSRAALFNAVLAGPADPPPFASVLDASVQSARKRGELESSRGRQADGLRRQQKVAKSLDKSSKHKTSKPDRTPSDPSAQRLDRMQADHQASTRQKQEAASERSSQDHRQAAKADSRTDRASRASDDRASSDQADAQVTADEAVQTDQENTAADSSATPAQQPQTTVAEQACATLSADPTLLSTSAPTGSVIGSPQPLNASTGSLGNVATMTAGTDASAHLAASSNGSQLPDAGAGASSGGEQTDGTPKSEHVGPRPISTGVDFQALMQQIGRARPGQASPQTTLTQGSPQEVNGSFKLQDSQSLQEMARVIRSSVGDKHSNMVLQLDPPELGSLRLDLRMHEQTLHLRIEAETQAGLDALTSRLSDLRQSLQQHGIRLDTIDAGLRPSSATHNAEQRQNDPHTSQDQNGSGSQSGFAHQDPGGQQGQAGSGRFGDAAMPMEQPWYAWNAAEPDAATTAAGSTESMSVDLVA